MVGRLQAVLHPREALRKLVVHRAADQAAWTVDRPERLQQTSTKRTLPSLRSIMAPWQGRVLVRLDQLPVGRSWVARSSPRRVLRPRLFSGTLIVRYRTLFDVGRLNVVFDSSFGLLRQLGAGQTIHGLERGRTEQRRISGRRWCKRRPSPLGTSTASLPLSLVLRLRKPAGQSSNHARGQSSRTQAHIRDTL